MNAACAGRDESPGRRVPGLSSSLSGRELVDALKENRLVPVMSEADRVTSVRQAAAVFNVTPPIVRRWPSLGLIPRSPRPTNNGSTSSRPR